MFKIYTNELKIPKRVKYQFFFFLFPFLKWDNINGRIFIYLQNLFFPISRYKNYTFESEHKKFDLKWVFNLIFFLSIKKRGRIFRTVEILSFFTSSRTLGLKDDSNVEFFLELLFLFCSFFFFTVISRRNYLRRKTEFYLTACI